MRSKELPENNLRILFRVNLIKSVNFATGLRRLFGGISYIIENLPAKSSDDINKSVRALTAR